MVKRTANAVWKGALKDGSGVVSTERGVLKETAYSWSGRFADGTTGTNPEELIAAAHAGCFSMALSGELGKVGITPEKIDTRATVSLDKVDEKWTVTGVHLDTTITAPGADKAKIEQAAEAAKKGCPISRLLASVPVTMQAKVA